MHTFLLIGDVRTRLAQIADESVHCVVTSPPYYCLRDYGVDGQIGLEPTPAAYVQELVEVFREVRRVLRRDGTLWLNLGDSYAGADKGTFRPGNPEKNGGNSNRNGAARVPGIAPKQRLMIPARVALALQADGWWLRDEIIWKKPNPMPHSGKDRTTPAHEMLYCLSKNACYHYDIDAIAEPAVSTTVKRFTDGGADKQRGHGRRHAGFNGRYAEKVASEGVPTTRHPRSVWSIPTRPFKGAHFATFPPELPRRCILAGCPTGGVVLDPFFGAGTTGLVAAELGRSAVGIELNPEYGRIAAERLGLHAVAPDMYGSHREAVAA